MMVVYLAMFSVEQLEALYVLQFDALGQSLPLQVNVRELWQGSGCIWRRERNHPVQTTLETVENQN